MRQNIPDLAVAALILALSTLVADAAESQIEIRAYPENQVVKLNKAVTIYIDQTNVGRTIVNVPHENGALRRADLDYIIRIRDEYGHEPALTPRGELDIRPVQQQFHSVQVNAVGPGQTAVAEAFPLSDIYRLEAHKTYHISFEFKKPIRYLATPIRSNWITVSVK